MTGFELQTSGIGSHRSTNLATTTARNGIFKKITPRTSENAKTDNTYLDAVKSSLPFLWPFFRLHF